MTRRNHLADIRFASTIPRQVDAGVLYVSMEHATAIHSCMCGCGREVVTPFGRGSWSLRYDGVGVSLSPSIGNGALACQSHYFIRDSRIVWLEPEVVRRDSTRVGEPKSFFRRLLEALGGSDSREPA